MPDRNGMLLSVNKLIHFLDKSVRHSHCKIKQKGKRARKTEKGSAGESQEETPSVSSPDKCSATDLATTFIISLSHII